ncbi:MAG: mechanosensitive ion channel [Marinilabiliales bacterium]
MFNSTTKVDTIKKIVENTNDTVANLQSSIDDAVNMAEKNLGVSKLTDKGYDAVIQYGPKLILAILTLIIGLWIIRIIVRGFNKVMLKKQIDESLIPFFKTLVSILLKAMLIISVMGMVGIEMTSFIAVLGAAGLAVGMALSGTLQNFAGGVMILIFKPFKVGDYISAQGYDGTVKEIQIFNTILITPDNKTIIIPNSGLSNSSMINFNKEEKRRVDWIFGIGYGDDLKIAKSIIENLIEKDERILDDPKHFIALGELAESSVNLTVRVWVMAKDYWGVFFDMNEKVYQAFIENGINIPFPQMDVYLHKPDK